MSEMNGMDYQPPAETPEPTQEEMDERRAEAKTRKGPQPSEDEREAIRQANVMTDFVKHPGWQLMINLCNARLSEGFQKILAPSTNPSVAMTLEYEKGRLEGFRVFVKTPQGIIETGKALRAKYNSAS